MNQGRTDEDKCKTPLEWFFLGDTGISSVTLLRMLLSARGDARLELGNYYKHEDIPYDAADFGCCFRLVNWYMPSLKPYLSKIDAPDEWKPILAQWNELEEIYKSGNRSDIYERIYQIRMRQGRSQLDLKSSAEACAISGAGAILTLIIVLICGMCGASEGNLRIKSERVEGAKTINGWGTGVTHGEYIVTAAHNLDGSAPMYAESGGEWVLCKVLIADADFDVAILKPSKPVKGHKITTGISGWRMTDPYREWQVKICGSKTFEMPVAYGQLHGVSGAGLFLDGKCLGILSMQVRCGETGRVFCTYCPMFVVDYLISKLKH